MNIFKVKPMSQKERWNRALMFGIPFSILVGIAYYYISGLFRQFEFGVLYLLIGYLIALFIQKVSHGAQKKFKILAVCCYILAILISDIIYPALLSNVDLLRALRVYLSYMFNVHNIIGLLIRALGAYTAYVTI